MIKIIDINKWIDVKPVHCHKRLAKNTLISKLRIISKDLRRCEILLKFDPADLGFFYDHEIDHLPGMLEVCALRQCSLALAHIVYGIPSDYVTVLDWFTIKLHNYGELEPATRVESTLLEWREGKNKTELLLEGLMMQEDYPVSKMEGKLVAMAPRLAAKIRHRKTYFRIEGGEKSVKTANY